ncbi:MAG: hypothetical protein JST38_20790 [Bacteroidetes bacterium]|nr:hypothetical protein [Bacteroidota bacterium]
MADTNTSDANNQRTDLDKEVDSFLYERGPSVGVTQIDGKVATSLRYERTEKDGLPRVNVTFMMDNKTVAKLRDLDAIDLENAIGERNAMAIAKAHADKGTLKGSNLANEYGLSPEENARRVSEKDARKEAEAQAAGLAPSPIDPAALSAVANKREEETQAAARAIKEQAAAQNAITKDKVKETGQGGSPDGGDNEVQSDEPFSTAEDDRLVPIVPPEVVNKYIKVGDAYHFQRNPEAVAFRDRGNKLETQSSSPAVADSMVRIAQARGWNEIRVTGSENFKREVWMEAAARGMHVRGYDPNDADKARLEAIRQRAEFRGREMEGNSISEGKQRTHGQEMSDAFQRESPEAAMHKHPELAGAYAGMEAARRKVGGGDFSPEEQRVVMERIRSNAVNSIEKGHVPAVNVKEPKSEFEQARRVDEQREERRKEKEIER